MQQRAGSVDPHETQAPEVFAEIARPKGLSIEIEGREVARAEERINPFSIGNGRGGTGIVAAHFLVAQADISAPESFARGSIQTNELQVLLLIGGREKNPVPAHHRSGAGLPRQGGAPAKAFWTESAGQATHADGTILVGASPLRPVRRRGRRQAQGESGREDEKRPEVHGFNEVLVGIIGFRVADGSFKDDECGPCTSSTNDRCGRLPGCCC